MKHLDNIAYDFELVIRHIEPLIETLDQQSAYRLSWICRNICEGFKYSLRLAVRM